jgi:hypothetical protein
MNAGSQNASSPKITPVAVSQSRVVGLVEIEQKNHILPTRGGIDEIML